MSDKYILDENGNPVPCDDLLTWGEQFEKNPGRVLAQDRIKVGEKDILVSTVFLGLDHNFGEGEPILWETMIFGGEHDQYQERYETRAGASIGHQRALSLVKQKLLTYEPKLLTNKENNEKL